MDQPSALESIRFVYRNASGEVSERHLIGWHESGHYILGRDRRDGKFKSFRIDRVVAYLGDAHRGMKQPFQDPPPSPLTVFVAPQGNRQAKKSAQAEICFTGFSAADKARLQDVARNAGMAVVQSVTVGLKFLVCGRNAGPVKIKKARDRYVYTLSLAQFEALAETGVLPDDQVAILGSRNVGVRLPDPGEYFSRWHYRIEPFHWVCLGVTWRTYVAEDESDNANGATSSPQQGWARDVWSFAFAVGDVFYAREDGAGMLQVVYDGGDGYLEVHEQVAGRFRGYVLQHEQLAFWLETGILPEVAMETFRGTSKGGLWVWRLGDV